MSMLRLILKEIVHRKGNAALSLVGVIVSVALCVAVVLLEEASQRETRRVMRDIGFNLRIVPKQANPDEIYFSGYSDATMPEASIHQLVDAGSVAYNHLVALLTQRIVLDEGEALLVGISGTLFPPGKKKPPMVQPVKKGTVELGSAIAKKLAKERGDSLQIRDFFYNVASVRPEKGNRDDITIYMALADAQKALDENGRISEIQAIDCLCVTSDENPAAQLRSTITGILPEAQVFHATAIADARARQRQLTEREAAFFIPFVIVIGAAWLAVLAMLNVRARHEEIGLLRALGHGTGGLTFLMMGRAFIIGIVGAVIGGVLGTWLALEVGPGLFPVTAKALRVDAEVVLWALAIAPVFAALSSFIPTMLAVTRDPALTLAPR